MPPPHPPHVVAAAWIATGPLGHLYAGVLDWVEAIVAWRRSRKA